MDDPYSMFSRTFDKGIISQVGHMMNVSGGGPAEQNYNMFVNTATMTADGTAKIASKLALIIASAIFNALKELVKIGIEKLKEMFQEMQSEQGVERVTGEVVGLGAVTNEASSESLLPQKGDEAFLPDNGKSTSLLSDKGESASLLPDKGERIGLNESLQSKELLSIEGKELTQEPLQLESLLNPSGQGFKFAEKPQEFLKGVGSLQDGLIRNAINPQAMTGNFMKVPDDKGQLIEGIISGKIDNILSQAKEAIFINCPELANDPEMSEKVLSMFDKAENKLRDTIKGITKDALSGKMSPFAKQELRSPLAQIASIATNPIAAVTKELEAAKDKEGDRVRA